MKLTPLSHKAHKVSLIPKVSDESPKKPKKDRKDVNANLKLENQLYLNNKNPKLFRVRYDIMVEVEGAVDIELVYDFDFSAENDVDQSLGSSLDMRSKIPNFAYPYIKNYLEQFLMMSGYGYIPFPLVDFIEQPIPEKE